MFTLYKSKEIYIYIFFEWMNQKNITRIKWNQTEFENKIEGREKHLMSIGYSFVPNHDTCFSTES